MAEWTKPTATRLAEGWQSAAGDFMFIVVGGASLGHIRYCCGPYEQSQGIASIARFGTGS